MADILKDTDFGGSDVNCGMKNNAKASISRFLEKTKTKGFIYSLIKYEPYQEYKNLYGKPWRTMKAILSEFSKLAVGKKFIIAPITPYSFLKYNLANAYKLRFASECRYFFDILPYLKGLSAEEKKNVFISDDCHFSAFGHKKVAAAFAGELTRSGILKK
jgi:hypothetical protein